MISRASFDTIAHNKSDVINESSWLLLTMLLAIC